MTCDLAIVVGGIVGLVTTRKPTMRFPSCGSWVSKRGRLQPASNGAHTGVIHSGTYAKPGSLEAKLCVEGRKLPWACCEAKGVEFCQVGKSIVATQTSELPRPDDLLDRGPATRRRRSRDADADGTRKREPHRRGIRAIYFPVTGIVDGACVSASFVDDARAAGATFCLGARVDRIGRRASGSTRHTSTGPIEARHVMTWRPVFGSAGKNVRHGARDPRIVTFRGTI